ncbi:MAG: type III pantothenate kinase [Bdellovibrionota bacterium]|nr:MAG: type III pantothenate kinase [Bdellovibrionota bacterium]
MLLAIDIGNTNIAVGCFDGKDLKAEVRLTTHSGRTLDEYEVLLASTIERRVPGSKIARCIISSVVPPITQDIAAVVERAFGIEPLVVGPGIRTGIQLKVPDPSSVGADRVVNSVAARHLYGTPALVVDFGTATTFDVVNEDGDYEGGIIAPGVKIALEALVSRTAKLPRIELSWPKTVVGKGTVAAMQSGAVIGYLCLVEGLIARIIEERGPIPHLICTGGLGRVFTEHSRVLEKYDPYLTLHGMRIISELNERPV